MAAKIDSRFWFLPPLFLILSVLVLITFPPLQSQPHKAPSSVRDDLHDDFDVASTNLSQLAKRDGGDATCKKGVSCKTVACCGSFYGGDTGTCGFGETFCGSDCDSQCDAKAECGQYADPPGKKCPLNVCCSQYGFCGSTSEFCEAGCQSNCVLNPPVPSGGSAVSVLNNKVIGYYEAWSARRSCRSFPPSAIPVEGLTHVNFAFAYIDPNTFEITTMDSATPESLFAETTNLKNTHSLGSDLQIFVALGGWTFSNNGTATQSVFPGIAASPRQQQKFADNLVSFMTRYGFDGVDIDWEYPGAPDRGGNEQQDTEHFVNLVRTLRATFRASPRGNYGLSFTIPTSYWYMRWFDVPRMLEYADWANLMAYDLHGVWDKHDPIGPLVQGHTNLTEIKLAADLLWRNNVPPAKVVLGMGFYGRSFELEDPDCSTPGCTFSGPGKPGPCTDSAGTLAYFEIMDIIKDQNPKVVYDREAAVKHIVFGDNDEQWVSFDDKTTLQRKVDWANSVGLGGVVIWSVDQDDNSFTALEGLTSQSLPSFENNMKRVDTAETDHWSSLNGQACKVSDCVSEETTNPPSGFGIAPNGKFQDTCSGGKVKFIWCPMDAMPESCQWRGSGSCHGQCHSGEVTLTHSPHGSLSCLKPGQQAFCCKSNTWSTLVNKCDWASQCGGCPNDAPYSVSSRKTWNGLFSTCDLDYCCPYDFQNCHWVGQGTCDDNECSATDVQVALDPMGDTGHFCAAGLNGRLKPLCCNTPKDLNPFLPVPLKNLFPTLPPKKDIPVFDEQTLSTIPSLVGEDRVPDAFFFVVIDGPPDTVSNVDKRDGSHLEFITGGEHHGQATQTAHFVCMDSSPESNCDDMHLGGLGGTILRMPDGMGFAQWAVAHSVTESNSSVPHHLARRAPAGAKVYELEYSYNFSKVKRASDSVYLRVDYADTHTYWKDVVEAAPQKRSLNARFWSGLGTVWKSIISRIRSQKREEHRRAILSKNHFNTLIFGDDGHGKDCTGADGFLKLNLAGSMRSEIKFGFTLVGTIQPFSLEEAYAYFDSDIYMSGQLDFDGKGILDINNGIGVERNLFSSPVTGFQASHPGIVSFSPELNAQVSLLGSGEIDGKFSTSFETGSSETMTTNAPPLLGDFDGDNLENTVDNAADGYLTVKNNTDRTAFALNLNLESSVKMKIFGYETSSEKAGAQFAARTPHSIRVVGDTGSGKPGILDAPQQASSDVVPTGADIRGWYDDLTYPIGSTRNPVVVFNGGESPPSPRTVPDINGYALFGDRDYMSCSGDSSGGDLVCTYDLQGIDPSLAQPDPPYKAKRTGLYNSTLEPRAGPSGGNAQDYKWYEYPENQGGPTDYFPFRTPTYPNGNNGAALDAERGHSDSYSLDNPPDCDDSQITANGAQGVNYDNLDSEHPIDRSVVPNHFGNFVQSGELSLEDGQGSSHQTNHPLFTFDRLFNYFAHDYRLWVPSNIEPNPPPGSAAADVADALGSTTNPGVMTNLERGLNILKGQLYTTEGNQGSEREFDTWMANPSQTTADNAFSIVRAAFAVFNYMNAIQSNRNAVDDGIQSALQQFDDLYTRTFGRQEQLRPLWQEFLPQWNTRVVNYTRRWITFRLDRMDNVYAPLAQGGGPMATLARQVLARIRDYRRRLDQEVQL